MRTLLHVPLFASCRILRVLLAEKGLQTQLKVEPVWDRRPEFLALNPAGDVPVLVEPDGVTLPGASLALEYLEEVYPDPPLLGADPVSRAEARRLFQWFDGKFGREVTDNLVGEKLLRRLVGSGQPVSEAIRAGHSNIRYHLDYVGYLADRRRYLAGDAFGIADIAAACHLSCVDYLGDVPWDSYPLARDWYARIKSRPSFRPLLDDTVPGAPPPDHYRDLDF